MVLPFFLFFSFASATEVPRGVTQEVWPILQFTSPAVGRSVVGGEDSTPTQVGHIENFDAAAKNSEPFGQRVRGYFVAPQSGEYKFHSSCSGQCDIYLSLEGKGLATKPEKKTKIISQSQETLHNDFDKYPEQVSHAVYLDKDRSYYIEGVERQKNGLGLMSVGVVLPDDTKVFPIKSAFLKPIPLERKDEIAEEQSTSPNVASIPQRKYGLAAKRKRDSLFQRLQKINEFIKHLQEEAKNNKKSENDLLKEAEKAEETASKDESSGEDGTFLDVKGEHFADQDAVEPGINIYVGNGNKDPEFAKANSKPADFSKIDSRVVANDKSKNAGASTTLSLSSNKPEVDKAEVRMPSPGNESLASRKSDTQLSANVQHAHVPDAMYNALMNLLKEEIAKSASSKGQVSAAPDQANSTANTTDSVQAKNASATMVENILNLFKNQEAGEKASTKSGVTIPGANLVALLRTSGNGLSAAARDEITKTNPVAKMMATMKPDDLAALFQLNEEINNLRTILAYKTVKSVRTEKTVHYPDYPHEEVHYHDEHPKEEPIISDMGLTVNPFTPPVILKKEKTSPQALSDLQDQAIRKWIHSQSGSQRDLHIRKDNTSKPGGPQIVKVDFSQPDKEGKGRNEEFQHHFPGPPSSEEAEQSPAMPSGHEEPQKSEESHENADASQIVPPSAMMGMPMPGSPSFNPENVPEVEHPSEPSPEVEHAPHTDIAMHHYPPYHEYHHDKGDTVVSQTSIVQETSKLLMAPPSLKTSLDPARIQNLMTEIGGLRKGVIDRAGKRVKPYLYFKGNTPMVATEEAGSKRGIIHPGHVLRKSKMGKPHQHSGRKKRRFSLRRKKKLISS